MSVTRVVATDPSGLSLPDPRFRLSVREWLKDLWTRQDANEHSSSLGSRVTRSFRVTVESSVVGYLNGG